MNRRRPRPLNQMVHVGMLAASLGFPHDADMHTDAVVASPKGKY
jgi:hypothetical protein